MISSMTAYAQDGDSGPWGALTWEVRSVNHRYLELYYKIPEEVRDLEYSMREIGRQALSRGKLDCVLKLTVTGLTQSQLELNTDLVKQLVIATEQVASQMPSAAPISPLDILRWPGVVQANQSNKAELDAAIKRCYKQALDKLKEARLLEGAALAKIIQAKLDTIMQQISLIKQNLPDILLQLKNNLINKIVDLNLNLDTNRLEQEYVYFLQKADIAEELERLEVHVNEFKRVLSVEKAVGRKLDFLLQEMNREANTLASKSAANLTSLAAVELKVLIEQIREQVQNLE